MRENRHSPFDLFIYILSYMHYISFKKVIIALLTIVAISAFGILFVRAFYYFPSDEVPLPGELVEEVVAGSGGALVIDSASPQKPTTVSKPKPVPIPEISMKLIIPKIKVDAKVSEVGITSKGNMAAPRSFSGVGWYKYGPKPGEIGSAVMAGHVDNGIALPAVFNKLDNLVIGDDIYVETKEKKSLHFRVTAKNVYDFDAAPPEVFSDKSGKLLKLITCTGSWLKEFRTHDKRLVVTAVLVE